MKRSKSWPLYALALLGAVVTVLFVASLGSGDAPRTAGGEAVRAEPRQPPPSVRGGRVPSIEARDDARFGRGGGGARGGPPPARQPFDSAATIELRERQGARVLEILDGIMDEEGHDHWVLHQELQDLLRKLGDRVDPAVRERLFDMLLEVPDKWKALVGESIGSLQGDEASAKRLIEMLKNGPESVHTRNAIHHALGKMNVTAVVPDLVAMLGQGHESEEWIVRTVGRIGGDAAAKALFDRLKGPLRPETRREIERVLGAAPHVEVIAEMKRRLREAPPDERASYLEVLGGTRDARHAEAVRELLENEKDPAVRRKAIEALGKFGDAESAEALIEIITREGPETGDATRALHRIQDSKTLETLAAKWDDLNETAQTTLLDAWARVPLPSPEMVKIAYEGLEHGSEQRRTAAAKVLGRRGNDAAVPALERYLHAARTRREQTTALQALHRIGTAEAGRAGLAGVNVLPDAQRETYRKLFLGLVE